MECDAMICSIYLYVDDTGVQWDREPYVWDVLTALEGYAGLHCCLAFLEGLNLSDVFGRRPCEVLANHKQIEINGNF